MSRKESGISAVIVVAVVVIVVFAALAIYFWFLSPGSNVFTFADFDAPGTRPGGNRGIMPSADLISEQDVDGGVSGKALCLNYSFSEGEWCGYWMNFCADESGYDVSAYRYIKMWVKGATGNERFKVELKDDSDGTSYTYVGVEGTEYREVTIDLSSFEKVPWVEAPANLSSLKQVNIVFDTAPTQGTVYIDEIRFTD